MFNIIGCLGVTVATVDTIDKAVLEVLRQIPIGNKRIKSMRNALERLTTDRQYHVEYGHTGCTIKRL